MTDEVNRIVEGMRNGNFTHLADFIASVYAELEQVKQERDGLNILLGQAQSMLETRTRERDAAVEDLRKVAQAVSVCFYCKSRDDEYVSNDCMDCINSCNWQWRGVKEANHHVNT